MSQPAPTQTSADVELPRVSPVRSKAAVATTSANDATATVVRAKRDLASTAAVTNGKRNTAAMAPLSVQLDTPQRPVAAKTTAPIRTMGRSLARPTIAPPPRASRSAAPRAICSGDASGCDLTDRV